MKWAWPTACKLTPVNTRTEPEKITRSIRWARFPALITDDGRVLYDSPVICEYLDAEFGGHRLLPAGGARRWAILTRAALADGVLDAAHPRPPRAAARRGAAIARLDRVAAAQGQRGARHARARGRRLRRRARLALVGVGCALGYLPLRLDGIEGSRALAAPCGVVRQDVAAAVVPEDRPGAVELTQKVIHVGIGVFGKRWCSEFLKTNVADGTIEVVALVDIDPKALAVRPRACSACRRSAATPIRERAFAEVAGGLLHRRRARPSITRRSSTSRIAHGLDVLCEKPIADTMEALAADRAQDPRGRAQDGGDDEPSLRPGQDDAAPDRALRRARPDQRDRLPLPGRHAPAHGVELAVPPHDAAIRC